MFSGCNQQKTTQPMRKHIVDAVFASGSIVSENQYVVTSQTDGYLNKSFLVEGDSVRKGQVFFCIENESQAEQLENAKANYAYSKLNVADNSPVLEQLIAQRLQIKNKLVTDSLNFIRHQKLNKSGAVSQVDYEKAKVTFENSKQDLFSINNQISDTKNKLQLEVTKSKANLASQQNTSSFYNISSKVDGVILQIHKKEGELVKRAEPIAEIGSGTILAKLFIVEEDINKLMLNQDVFIELNTEKNKSYKAILSKIYPYFDAQEQSFIAEAQFVDKIKDLKSGTQLQANIKTNEKSDALVIPAEYLLPGNFVITKTQQKIKVTVGIRTSEWIEILSGIDETSILILPN